MPCEEHTLNRTLSPTQQACWLLMACLALSACSSVPPYEKPAMNVPAQFKQAALFAPANPDAAQVPDAWWTVFNDPVLSQLHERLLSSNPSLQTSAAAVNAAQAALASSRSGLFPNLNVSAGSSRSYAAGSTPSTGNAFSLQAGLSSWELDLWGRTGATVDAQEAKLQASQASLASARLSVQATLTQTYFACRTAQAQTQLLTQTVKAYSTSLELTQNRYQAGVVSAADVAQAQSQLQSTQAQLAESRLQATQLEHALAVLLGLAPAAFNLPASTLSDLPTPPAVPVQLASQLLERRPDIAAAERQVAAANAQIGAAKAAYFPSLTLSANAGYRSSDFSSLVQSANKFWSIGPTLALSVFDAGARSAAVDSARATHEEVVASYKQTVLTALQEVEDNLVAASSLQEQFEAQRAALAAANKNLDITQNQYKAGMVSYLNVVSAQSSALSAQSSVLSVRNRQLTASTQLLKNLAGRWHKADQ
jgi:NodT family efflux transporter outer membrane factor (OMF) lipoprotein